MYNPFIILVVADVGSHAAVQSVVAFLMVRTLPCEGTATFCRSRMCLGYVLLCRYSHLKVAEVMPIPYRIT